MNVLHDDIISHIEITESYEIFNYDNAIDGFERSLTYFLQKKSYIVTLYFCHHCSLNMSPVVLWGFE